MLYHKVAILLFAMSEHLADVYVAASCSSIPDGYTLQHDNVYYKKHNGGTFITAAMACQSEGATLPVINTLEAMVEIKKLKGLSQSEFISL